MYLTLEELEKRKACDAGKKWFQRTFPNGGELMDVMKHKYVSTEMFHWGYANLSTSNEEKEFYRQKLNIKCGEKDFSIYESSDIDRSSYVTHSKNVENGHFVFHCEDVLNSSSVSQSSNVEDSECVYGSEFVFKSRNIFQSKNVTNGLCIINSDYVFNSDHIINAAAVKYSAYVGDLAVDSTKRIDHSYFITRGVDLDHCLFCSNLQGKKYHLFNKEITPEEYDIFVKQMSSILRGWEPELVVDNEWPKETVPLDDPRVQRNIIKQYNNLPDKFWRWVKTLPGYDPAIMYAITFNPKAQ